MNSIPSELIYNILKYLDSKNMLSVAYVSKYFSNCVLSFTKDIDLTYLLQYVFLKDNSNLLKINIDKISNYVYYEFVSLYIDVFEKRKSNNHGNVLLFLDTIFSSTINPIYIYYIVSKYGDYLHQTILNNYISTNFKNVNNELVLNPGIDKVLDIYISSFSTNKFYNVCEGFKHTYTFIYDHIVRHKSVQYYYYTYPIQLFSLFICTWDTYMRDINFCKNSNDTIGRILIDILETEVMIDINCMENKILHMVCNIPCVVSFLYKLCAKEQYQIQDIIYNRIGINILCMHDLIYTDHIDILHNLNISKIDKGNKEDTSNYIVRRVIKNDDVDQFIDIYDKVGIDIIKLYIKEYLPLNILYYISTIEDNILPICVSEEDVVYNLSRDILVENNFIVIV
ncbi:F-box domain-containing protein with Leucine-rich repeat [Orpheovirus IHUMI-LCC2]|uniref:F-box domain-containing protein with Leucine-rich repeat n=1 Tax=Orpheovirus IHUMI-LCC2 TaxID=2023057 RepID=A0A2I2L3N8_9VIRU|nr:F-box domain-containing protein with Leucine-rich repeat [Orpheovirus IHUMI-LCC2]SNW62175.1 F-box domain-containing protein with Leucine-rich repeat [Orpheovirus IHUMI-LCC2]